MKLSQKIFIICSISIAFIGCDQVSKRFAIEYLPKYETFSYFFDVLRIRYVENKGAFLGLGNNLPDEYRFWLFIVTVGLFLFGLLVYMLVSAKLDLVSLIGLSLAFSGGASNFYDRVVNDGAVVDFLNIGLGSLRTGIFNLADMVIMIGMAILVYVVFKGRDVVKP